MRKITTLFFAAVMMLSVVFIGDAISSNNPSSVQAQTVRVKRKRVGVTRKIYRGGKYVGTKVWDGTKWVGIKTWKGTKYVGRKTYQGTKYVGKKSWKTGRKVVSRTKKIIY